MACPHMNFEASVNTGRIQRSETDPTIVRYTVELTVRCADCKTPLEFKGLPIGVDTHGPTMSPDGLEARMVAVMKGDNLLADGRISAILRGHEGNA